MEIFGLFVDFCRNVFLDISIIYDNINIFTFYFKKIWKKKN